VQVLKDGSPEDELGDDVEDGLTPLSGRMLCRQQNGTNLDQISWS
jgi:hypothetical protein